MFVSTGGVCLRSSVNGPSGCTTSGDTADEVKQNIKDAVESYIESLREHNEPIPPPTSTVDIVEAA